jgi:hypothetical protein
MTLDKALKKAEAAKALLDEIEDAVGGGVLKLDRTLRGTLATAVDETLVSDFVGGFGSRARKHPTTRDLLCPRAGRRSLFMMPCGNWHSCDARSVARLKKRKAANSAG